jgi:hypothetical protein
MRLEAPQIPIAVSNIALHSPYVQSHGEGSLFVGKCRDARLGEKIGTVINVAFTDLLLLCLNGFDHSLVNKGDNMFPANFTLVKAEIPLMAIITDEAIQWKATDLIDTQAHLNWLSQRRVHSNDDLLIP